jgi:predicted nucleic acid-binding protein
MRIVFDAGVIFAGAGWRGEAYLCLVAFARRRVQAFATAQTLEELRDLVEEKKALFRHPPWTILNWYSSRVRLVEAAPLGKPRSRDRKDDPYLACALAAGAEAIVTRDEDLLGLDKPFGIAMLTPRALLSRLARPL